MMSRKTILAFAALIGLYTASSARATVLNPGDFVIPADGTVTAPGTTVLGPVTETASGTTSGTTLDISVVEYVVKDSGTGHLDFVYQVTNKSDSTTSIEHVTVVNYQSVTTNVGYQAVSGDSNPTYMDRDNTGNVITWDFYGSAIPAGGTSALLIIKTNRDNANFNGTVSTIDGQTVTVAGYQPTLGTLSTVPEPSTMALAGLGALGMISYGLRRRKALGA